MYRFLIRGVVQGVGFRPYIRNACAAAGLNGYVQNVGSGVVVEVDDRKAFEKILKGIPPLARIDSCDVTEVDAEHRGFSIRESEGEGFAEVPPDQFLCADCRRELREREDRRHGYFFITCTNCGPRFSMAERSPYDRHTTTMSAFPMCQACGKEYADPADRRYHAQTIACHACGPRLTLLSPEGSVTGTDDAPVRAAAALLKRGEVVAIKGIGGFHLASAPDASSVLALRGMTGRPHKPYAVMCRDIAMAGGIAEVGAAEEALLTSAERPIVVLRKRDPASLREVTELDSVGVMLPYTALHYLLFDHVDTPLVMTSSNRSDEPISTRADEQLVPHILDHDRRIANPVDDSVVKLVAGKRLLIRRSRGFVPGSIPLAGTGGEGSLLCLGAEMHNTFCVFRDGRAVMSQYMGTTSNATTFGHYRRMVRKMLEFTRTEPQRIVADLHPGYNTSLYAEELAAEKGIPLVRVQHHRAHAYSAAVEHGLLHSGFAAIVCDGLGYGDDGAIWGGEVFLGEKRIGHLQEHLQLGGDAATRFPARMLYSLLRTFLSEEEAASHVTQHIPAKDLAVLERQREARFNSPMTTSTGRVFDAAAALLGLCSERTYEGRPAMLLEAHSSKPYGLAPVIRGNVVMTTPLFEYLVANLDKDSSRLAATVQQYVAEGLYSIASGAKRPIVFSGGCAYSRVMTGCLVEKGVLVNELVPAGDGGISFGQAAACLSGRG